MAGLVSDLVSGIMCIRIFKEVNGPSIAAHPGFDHGHWWVDRTTEPRWKRKLRRTSRPSCSPASYNSLVIKEAVRAMLRVLEEKGHVRHEEESLHYVYLPTVARDTARRSALRHMVSTFFEGSVEETVAALLDLSAADLSKQDLDRISNLIEEAKKEGV